MATIWITKNMAKAHNTIQTARRSTKAIGMMTKNMAKALNTIQTASSAKANGSMAN
jgi:hypothetical protein